MKKISFIFLNITNWSRITMLFLLCNAFSAAGLFAQGLKVVSDVTAELTKTSRSSSYGGTFILGNQAKVVYVSSTNDEGVQYEEYDFSLNGGGPVIEDKFISSDSALKTLPWYMPKSRVEKISVTNGKWLEATSAFGSGMKLWRGRIKKHYVLGVYTRMEYIKEEAVKPKAGDIWRITPGGYKSLSDINAMATEYGFYRDLYKFGSTLLMPASSTLLAAGVITEKVSLSKNQKYASNRVAVLNMNGMDFDDMQYDIYELPFTAVTVVSGLGQDDNLCSLFAPLNGPTTLSSLKHLYWKDKKDQFTMMRFTDDRKLVESVSFTSKMLWGDYSILNGGDATYILGKGNADFNNWYRGLEYKKLNGIQVVKIKDGKTIYSSLFTEDEINSKLAGMPGEKAKFKLSIQNNSIDEVINLPNGDSYIIAHTPLEAYGIQISPSGELKAFYSMPLGEKDKIKIMNYQYMIKDNDLIFVVNLQPAALSNDTHVKVDTHKTSGGGITVTTTKTSVYKLNEVFMHSYVFRINPAQNKITDMQAFNGKDFFTMGSYPAMFTSDALYFAGREKAPKGKVIHVVKIEL